MATRCHILQWKAQEIEFTPYSCFTELENWKVQCRARMWRMYIIFDILSSVNAKKFLWFYNLKDILFGEQDLKGNHIRGNKTYSILEGFIHSTSLQVLISLALPLVEVKIMTPKSTEKREYWKHECWKCRMKRKSDPHSILKDICCCVEYVIINLPASAEKRWRLVPTGWQGTKRSSFTY